MTTPDERTRSVMHARLFLEELSAGARASGVPEEVRREARRLLRHYPEAVHLDRAAVAWPQIWGPALAGRADAPSYPELLVRSKMHSNLPTSSAQVADPPMDAEHPPLVTTHPEVMGGTPVLAGSRLPVHTLLACVAEGSDWPRMLNSWPWLTPDHVEAARQFAEKNDVSIRPWPAAPAARDE